MSSSLKISHYYQSVYFRRTSLNQHSESPSAETSSTISSTFHRSCNRELLLAKADLIPVRLISASLSTSQKSLLRGRHSMASRGVHKIKKRQRRKRRKEEEDDEKRNRLLLIIIHGPLRRVTHPSWMMKRWKMAYARHGKRAGKSLTLVSSRDGASWRYARNEVKARGW